MTPEELVAAHIDLAKRQAAKFCRDYNVQHLADEMESAALLGLTRAAQTEARTATFTTLAYACVRNELLQVLRTLNRQSKLDVDEMYRDRNVCVRRIGGTVELTPAHPVTAEDKVAVSGILATMPEHDRKLIRLYYFEDKTFQVAGKEFGGLKKCAMIQKHQRAIERAQKRINRGWKKAA